MQPKTTIIPIVVFLNLSAQPNFALDSVIEPASPPVSKVVPSVQRVKKPIVNTPIEFARRGSSQSHCRYDPKVIAARQQLARWLTKITESIESSQEFPQIKKLVVSNFNNRDRLVCWLTLDAEGQKLKNLRLCQSAYKTGPTLVDADAVLLDPANKLISSIMPFETPPNKLPATKGISIIFERKYPDVLITVSLTR
jgi:hypothetical protein